MIVRMWLVFVLSTEGLGKVRGVEYVNCTQEVEEAGHVHSQ